MKHMNRRGFIGGTAALASASALAACSAGVSEEQNADAPIDVTMTTWSSDPKLLETWAKVADDFREANPRLGEFTIQQFPFDEYNAQLTIQLSGSKPPNLGFLQAADSMSWAQAGVLRDISAMKTDPAAAWEEVLPASYEHLEGQNGELWAFPIVSAAHVFYYNRTAFEEAGLEAPDELLAKGEWTWQKLKEISKELVDSGVVDYGFDIQQFTTQLPGYVDRGFGTRYWPNGTECGLTDPESVQAIQFIHDMRFVDNSMAQPGSIANFPTGDTGFTVGSTSFMGQLVDAPFDWGLLPQPKGDVPYEPSLAQAHMGVFENGQDPELAEQLLIALVSAEAMNQLDGLLIGPRESQLSELPEVLVGANPNLTVDEVEAALVDPQSSATADPPLANSVQVNTETKPVIEGLWTANADIPEVLADVCAVAEPLLEQ